MWPSPSKSYSLMILFMSSLVGFTPKIFMALASSWARKPLLLKMWCFRRRWCRTGWILCGYAIVSRAQAGLHSPFKLSIKNRIEQIIHLKEVQSKSTPAHSSRDEGVKTLDSVSFGTWWPLIAVPQKGVHYWRQRDFESLLSCYLLFFQPLPLFRHWV